MLKLIPDDRNIRLKNIPKMMWKNIETYHPEYSNFQIVASILEPAAWYFLAVTRFICDLFLGTSGKVTPWTDVDLPGAPLVKIS